MGGEVVRHGLEQIIFKGLIDKLILPLTRMPPSYSLLSMLKMLVEKMKIGKILSVLVSSPSLSQYCILYTTPSYALYSCNYVSDRRIRVMCVSSRSSDTKELVLRGTDHFTTFIYFLNNF